MNRADAPSAPVIVLVGTTHPGNIGAAARAMKTMGIRDLRLVAPRQFPAAEATARAAGADDILAAASVHETLPEALGDCAVVIGASARARSLDVPRLEPREAAAHVTGQAGGRAAFVFGREHSGLRNEELDRCHFRLAIPTDPAFGSLNLAAAVQVVCYELRLAHGGGGSAVPADRQPVGAAEMERFHAHLERVLIDLDFLDPANPRHLMRRLRQLFNRARPDPNEINILRGILTAVEDHGRTLRRRLGR